MREKKEKELMREEEEGKMLVTQKNISFSKSLFQKTEKEKN